MTEPSNQPAPPFETRIFVHGVGSYVPHPDGKQLLVLFPDQDHAMERGIRAPAGGEICRHHMVVQMDARALDPSLPPNLWLTLDVAKHWIGFSSDSEVPMNLGDGRIDGLADMETLLEGAGVEPSSKLDPRALPGAGFDSRLLAAGFYAARGAVGPSGEYQGPFQIGSGGSWSEDRTLSSVIRVELGEIRRFALNLRPFGAPVEETSTIPLHPVDGELEVWIRHFCDLAKPDPDSHEPEPEELDADFVLNYALREDLESLLASGADRLPVPRVSASWEHGGNVAGKPRQCMGSLEAAIAFSDPMTS